MSRIVGFRRRQRRRHLRQLVSNKGANGFVPKIVVIDFFIIIIITVVVVFIVFIVICGLEMDGERKASGAGDGE